MKIQRAYCMFFFIFSKILSNSVLYLVLSF